MKIKNTLTLFLSTALIASFLAISPSHASKMETEEGVTSSPNSKRKMLLDNLETVLDVNKDGEINIQDLWFAVKNPGETVKRLQEAADFNDDGFTDFQDIKFILKLLPQAILGKEAIKKIKQTLDQDGDGDLTFKDAIFIKDKVITNIGQLSKMVSNASKTISNSEAFKILPETYRKPMTDFLALVENGAESVKKQSGVADDYATQIQNHLQNFQKQWTDGEFVKAIQGVKDPLKDFLHLTNKWTKTGNTEGLISPLMKILDAQ